MSIARHHTEWLSLIEVSGPFLSMPALMRAFPQGLEAHNPERFRLLRVAYEEWEDNNEAGRRMNPAVHSNWIRFILRNVLELPEDCIAEGQAIPQTLQTTIAQHDETLRPSFAVLEPGTHKSRLLIQVYPATQDLSKPVSGHTWKASPDTRMMELLHASGVRLGLVTNGEQWMLVDAPRNETTGYASWYAHLWLEEKITLQAFTSLLNAGRFFAVPEKDTLEALLAESATNQQEVTDQLGYQVRRAVEVLVESLDRADQDHGRELLAQVKESELYEAALTVMMRLVFLFCAEERGLILLGDPIYDENYAVSTLEKQLRETADQHGEEILERRHDAWCRLLSIFRGVFGGIQHERMTLPPYGGRLFDPDRFAFLEGRRAGTTWKLQPATPLPVNNRTVLHLLDALQFLRMKVAGGGPAEARRISFRALDIEQIGHVYEGLLDHTAKRASETVLGLTGNKDSEPEVPLSQLEEIAAKGEESLVEYLKVATGRSVNAIRKCLNEEIDLTNFRRFEAVCGTSDEGKLLLDRIKPFIGVVRDNSFGYPVVIPKGSVYVTSGTDRRSSGTHYTPKSLTEPIVQYTLEPLVYIGPAEGKPKEQWQLRSAADLLKLKICDMTCGSGAFHVQTCRYLAERLVEAWEQAEKSLPAPGPGKLHFPTITPEGKPSTGKPGELLIPKDTDERLAYARRIVAQRCIYGVDINPLAADMAKLSLWLLTLAKDKPFTFLDHAILCGDSLLGIHDLKQLKTFTLDGKGEFTYLFAEPLDKLVDEAVQLRLKIEMKASNTTEDIEEQSRLMAECDRKTAFLKCVADMLIAAELKGGNPKEQLEHRDHAAVQVGYYLKAGKLADFQAVVRKELQGRRCFHWPIEFPEVFAQGGFDAFVGNPPFIGGMRIEPILGNGFRQYLVRHLAGERTGVRGAADLSCYFLLRASTLVLSRGVFTLITSGTVPQGDARVVALEHLLGSGFTIFRAESARPWPGSAATQVCVFWFARSVFHGTPVLDGKPVDQINSALVANTDVGEANPLASNSNIAFEGAKTAGTGFLLSAEEATRLLSKNSANREVVRRYMSGEDANTHPTHAPSRWVINFRDMPLRRSDAGIERSCAEDFPDCLAIIEDRVKPERLALSGRTAQERNIRERWWQFYLWRPALAAAMKGLKRVLISSRVTAHHNFCFAPTDIVFSDRLVVIAKDDYGTFATISSSVHGEWAHRPGATTQGTTLNYFPTWAFATFPFPKHTMTMEAAGRNYDDHRKTVMAGRQEGMTKTYNRFHDPEETAADIQKLRELHIDMDKAVAAAYGWDDLKLDHDFHEIKHTLRFTISDPARREVLARLLQLNHERYAEEVAAGLHEKGKGKAKNPKEGRAKVEKREGASLFGGGE